MGIINVLSKQIANLIAAGEVVERPVSVVKELVENSIDAGASEIVIEIKNGGCTFIRVTDNGKGIDREDAALAFARHATSKISVSDDLNKIATMGFRGEALAAISSVSNTQMITRTKDTDEGTLVEVNGGEISAPQEIGAPIGTTIIVENLFYNTPARLKFLKKDVTEAAVITSYVEKVAVAAHNIAFKLIKDGKTSLLTDGGGMKNAVRSIFGGQTLDNMLEVDYTYEGAKVKGYVGKPQVSRPNRNLQFFSLNGRVIRSRVFQSAVEEAMKSHIMVGKYPICAINVEMPFEGVDVNVHPSKMEVKFANERKIYEAVYFGVKNTFFADESRPAFTLPQNKNFTKLEAAPMPPQQKITFNEFDMAAWSYPKATEVRNYEYVASEKTTSLLQEIQLKRQMEEEHTQLQKQQEEFVVMAKQAEEDTDFILVGELFKTYIVAQLADEVLLIDKHAAQERIIYEKLKSADSKGQSQKLLSPIVLYLTKEESVIILENIKFFENLGFEIEDFGDGSLLLRGVPSDINADDGQDMITEAATKLSEGKIDAKPEIYEELLHSMACKAAMKGGQYNADIDLYALTKQLLSYPDIKHCPHGRPVAMTLSKSYIENQFKR